MGISYLAVRASLKACGHMVYRPQIVHSLNQEDYAARVAFAELVFENIRNSPRFIELLMFSDESIFHLEAGINQLNCSHWCP